MITASFTSAIKVKCLLCMQKDHPSQEDEDHDYKRPIAICMLS